tara:strand:+ start:10 stop:483 length:474 start_codon:yes stop_codon:yes gene_type:complete
MSTPPPINTNYTITRVPEAQDVLGCTDFQTTETEDTDAALGGGGLDVDGDIIWHIDGNLGYDVDVVDFSIPGATLTIPLPGFYVFTGGPHLDPTTPPILGVVMEQFSPVRIIVTIYLHPSPTYNITGPIFNMPSNNISVTLPIEGCAKANGNTNTNV